MFGRKKKDEKEGQETQDASTSVSTSEPTPPVTSTPVQAPPISTSSPTPPNPPPISTTSFYQPPRSSPAPTQADEDSSLSRLLQSLLKDLPTDASTFGGEQPRGFANRRACAGSHDHVCTALCSVQQPLRGVWHVRPSCHRGDGQPLGVSPRHPLPLAIPVTTDRCGRRAVEAPRQQRT